ncbi:MAG: PilZ domain-containing protein [Pseudomonadota bacterium]
MGTNHPDGVACQLHLPMQWQAAGELSPPQLERLMQVNAALLHTHAFLDTPAPADDAAPATRLEAKVDLALALLGKLLDVSAALPLAQPLTLSANAAEWLSKSDPGATPSILLSLWLSPQLPQPLTLPAHIRSAHKEGGQWRLHAEFHDLGESVQEHLTRTVFRYHRRALQARRG